MSAEERRRVLRILRLLDREHPDARTPLHHGSAWELLIATMLSAQCTDEAVNRVTPALFARYGDPAAMAGARVADLERLIRTIGLYRTKARNIRAASELLLEKFAGQVPGTIEEMVSLPGVGRKTANVLLGQWFGRPSVVVDTHFGRVVRRLALTAATEPQKVERELRALVPEQHQSRFSMVVNFHGRRVCRARKPDCEGCVVRALCPYPDAVQA